jgi:signal peptidase I
MLTVSLVDIDREESGEPRAHFLIKRAVGMAGDRFVLEKGEMKMRFAGEDRWVEERDYVAARNWNHHISRLISADKYPALKAAGQGSAWSELGLPVPERLNAASREPGGMRYFDSLAFGKARLETLRGILPHEARYRVPFARDRLGLYVPEGRILPLGDNRDNSRDGRYFGPVRVAKVLGKGAVIYWPARRIGQIR